MRTQALIDMLRAGQKYHRDNNGALPFAGSLLDHAVTEAIDVLTGIDNSPDRRTGLSDRRNSADGSLIAAIAIHGAAVRASSDRRYGLRKDDLARWVKWAREEARND